MKAKTIIFSLVTALIIASLMVGCLPGPVEVEQVVVCKDVDSEYKPVEPTTVFPSGTETIYVSVKTNNITPEDKITTRWIYLESGEELNIIHFSPDEAGSGYIGFSLLMENGFPAGKYNTVVYLNNEEIETVEFSVQ